MTKWMNLRVFLVLAVTLTGSAGASAQYDRDGRYVPSPNGIPTDPNARPIPMYPGTPGQAIGEPMAPRVPGITPLPPQSPRIDPFIGAAPLPIRLTAEICADGWSKASGMTRTEFRDRCRRLRR